MVGSWARRWAGVGLLLTLAIGCKSPPPNLKPPIGPDELNKPPMVSRYDNPEWPKEVLVDANPKTKTNKDDPAFKGPGGMTNNLGGMATGMQQNGVPR